MKLYKPHITILTPLYSDSSPVYLCKGLGWTGCGDDPVEAYESWYDTLPVKGWGRWLFMEANIRWGRFLKGLEISGYSGAGNLENPPRRK